MKITWMPITAGILCIIAGGLTLLVSVLAGIGLGVFFSSNYAFGPDNQALPAFGLWVVIFLPLFIISAVAIAGGYFALRREIWGFALAGAICSLLTIWLWPLGIAAIVLVSISKHEFYHQFKSTPPPSQIPPPSSPPTNSF